MTARMYAVAGWVVLLSGCATALQSPVVDAPAWQPPGAWQQVAEPGKLSDQGWLRDFNDPQLNALVTEAILNNPELQLTRARLAAGVSQATIAGAPRLPELDAEFGAGRARRSADGSHSISNSVDAGLSFSWEADLWSKLSDSARAAVLDAEALAEDLRAARLSLAANTAKAWFNAVEATMQRDLSQNLVDNLEANLEVLEEGYRAGLFDALDIHLARANLAAEQGRLATRQRTLGDAVRDLERRLGRYPASALPVAAALPSLPPPVPAGLPSTLLQRRADIRAADSRFSSALARLSRAHKDRFPSLRLTAEYGISSNDLAELLRGDSLVWSALVSLTQPLFDGGRLRALEQQRVAEAQQARASYLGTLLTAFAEVESALQQEQQLLRQVKALRLSTVESDFAESLAFEQYRAGLVDYITVLEAQRRAFTARSSYSESRNQQLQNRLNLYLALGGEFMNQQAIANHFNPPASTADSGQPLTARETP